MSQIPVQVKHAGKSHELTLDTSAPFSAFKEQIYTVTGVPVDRMKIMLKGKGMLKDDTNWSKIAVKPAIVFTVIGAAGELPKPPEKQTVFLEDMDDEELAQVALIPSGLRNLGNTCYMNASLQALRAVPELQEALSFSTGADTFAMALNSLYTELRNTASTVTPMRFLQILREVSYAEEAYSYMLNTLRSVRVPSSNLSVIEQYMKATVRRELKSDEAPAEQPTVAIEEVMKLECHIGRETAYLNQGILNSFTSTLSKLSPTLGREATYTQTSRLTRLPKYLNVHMVRFAWRADIAKKAKVMRQVKFPLVLDALEFVTPELKEKLLPVNRKLTDVERERFERRRTRGRTQQAQGGTSEVELRTAEKTALEALVDPGIKNDLGASESGLFDLVAIVTHKGAAADSGHYMGFVKQSVFRTAEDAKDENDDWFKFDDDKVSVFPKDKIATLSGGGEDSAAYVLLYKSRQLE
ncbi:cysteine proteinase [Fistulina hepatica ATCC 64428]|uniref:Ubiquitin carboxyl-terminal hydrolase n=1 Tax=Fistulina hepatica ATCC 64428 TaxID=1128425 RepID=A0A0D7A2E3_9AGAR|nr:cysteine proteinase [Fistulina hepatica ATCC 64428]